MRTPLGWAPSLLELKYAHAVSCHPLCVPILPPYTCLPVINSKPAAIGRVRAQHPTLMRVCIRKSSHSMPQLINQAVNQQELSQNETNNSWHAAAGTNQLEPMH
jgi:hypothetical protein